MIYSVGVEAVSTDVGTTIAEITSTEEEKKTVKRLEFWDVLADEVLVSAYLERETIVENVPLEVAADISPARVIELDVAIPVGQTLKIVLTPQVLTEHGSIDGLVYYTIE